jgi:hypothetical protein
LRRVNMQVIYAVECVKNGLAYVGYSANHMLRWRNHRRLLRRRIHAASRMVDDWHKYGPDAFVVRVLEILPPASDIRDARQAELRWQRHFARLGRLYDEAKCSVCGRPYDFTSAIPGLDNLEGEQAGPVGPAGDVGGRAAGNEMPAREARSNDR